MGRDALDRVGLSRLGDTSARLLTYGQQRLLELARALAAGPEVILLDEPSAGLNDAETAALADLFRSLRDEGFTLAVVDHKIDFIDSICDRISVLELGQVIAVGRPEEVWASPRVVEAYLGESDDA
jgi:ABC-type branched-subunit amino acid transport system ATPase component